MSKSSVLVVLCLCIVSGAFAANWAVLVAGSDGFWNYRHQTDICHAFQILKSHGVPESNIIVMQRDDLADDPENPFPGQLFNHPTKQGEPGIDVYAGCGKDYISVDVTAANFLAVLKGESDQVPAGKKVLKSTAEDNVFVYYSDHGGTGLVAMPEGPPLYATELIDALKVMHSKKMYKKLVFYLEACESGSMFANILPAELNVFATTASNPDESSWGWYCPPDDSVNGVNVGSCLGDEYSVRWMEDSDLAPVNETLQEQFTRVKAGTKMSHVCEWGDQSFNSDPIWLFQGGGGKLVYRKPRDTSNEKTSVGWDSRDVKLHWLMNRYLRTHSAQHRDAVERELQERTHYDTLFTSLARTVFGNEYQHALTAQPRGVCDTQCCQPVVNALYAQCGKLSDYALKYVRTIVNMCEHGAMSGGADTRTPQTAHEHKMEVTKYMLEAVKNLCTAK